LADRLGFKSMTRLAIFTSHPIQYQAPWFRALAACSNIDIKVFFSFLPNQEDQGVGFGTAFRWDIPLLDGYDWAVLEHFTLPRFVPAYARRWSRGIAQSLNAFNPQVSLILGWHEFSLIQALLASRRLNLPVIMRGESNDLRARPTYVQFLQRTLFAQCDGFLAIGAANAGFYRDAGVPQKKIYMAPYFVENERFYNDAQQLRGSRSDLRSAWGIPEGGVCFAFVGKLEPKKRVFDFIEAIRLASINCKRVHGLIVGDGAEMAEARHRVEVNRLPISFTGFLNQSEIARAYVAADAIVLPSNYGETWGLVINEGMATGLPALVSDRVGCANDLVIEGETGSIFSFGNVWHLSEKLIEWASNDALRQSLGQRALSTVTEQFSISRATAQTVEAVRQINRLSAP
jgi:glycosyltransferase involved in cell wall biosynthesis